MAKTERSYMQMYIPNGGKTKYSSEMALFYGLDKRKNADSQTMSFCQNIDVKSLPYIKSVEPPLELEIGLNAGQHVGFYAYGDFCYVLEAYKGEDKKEKIKLTKIKEEGGVVKEDDITVTEWENTVDTGSYTDREMAVFCFYDVAPGTMSYETTPKYYLLIYPDRKYIRVDFSDGESADVIAPEYEYNDFTRATHNLKFKSGTFGVGLTLEKDGTAQLVANVGVVPELEKCNARVTFTDANNPTYACVGTVPVDGSVADDDYGLFLQEVKGNDAVLRLLARAPTSAVNTSLVVADYNSGETVKSFDVKIDVGNTFKSTYKLTGLSASKTYYCYVDYNIGAESERYDLTFKLSDKVTSDVLTINGKLKDNNGNNLIVDVSRKYIVSYVFSNENKTYTPDDNEFEIQLAKKETSESLSPQFQHITVWNSRLFGTRDNVVVCSCAGTPFDWTLDTPESYLESYGLTIGGYDETHSWYSTTQANTQASGDIVAITSYDGHPVIFKDDYMHEIYNTKNPFRIQDICAIGCVSARSICELDSVLYFASKDGIYRYAGGYPKRISDSLGDFVCDKETVCGACDGVLYVYNPNFETGSDELIYSYYPSTGLWSCIQNPFYYTGKNDSKEYSCIYAFSRNADNLYLLSVNGNVAVFPDPGSAVGPTTKWFVTSELNMLGSAGDKRIHSIKILSDSCLPEMKINGTKVLEFKNINDGNTGKSRALIRGFDNDCAKIDISGQGDVKIHRVDVVYTHSGNRYR